MRLWSLHPCYLDQVGLVALWREGLLARAVLRGVTVGYRSHPQLERFYDQRGPVSAINRYLRGVASEAARRGYRFDRTRLGPVRLEPGLIVSRGQLELELSHLRAKLAVRAPSLLDELPTTSPHAHPAFDVRAGGVAEWERARPATT